MNDETESDLFTPEQLVRLNKALGHDVRKYSRSDQLLIARAIRAVPLSRIGVVLASMGRTIALAAENGALTNRYDRRRNDALERHTRAQHKKPRGEK